MLHRPLSIMATLAALLASPTLHAQIEQADVERVLSALADDSMRGRGVFTPEIDQAAAFLASEFGTIGLGHFGGLNGYEQRFPVFAVRVEDQEVVLNGRAVPAEQTALMVSGPIAWTQDSDVEVIVVGRESDPNTAMRRIFGGGGNVLAVLDPVHEQVFRRIRGIAARGSRTLGGETEGRNAVLVLAEVAGLDAYTVRVETVLEEVGTLANVVGTIPGRRSDELVIFSAHYDHVGVGRPVNGDSIRNGANDDASGTVAVVELARDFMLRGQPERTLVFVAFTAEESGGWGSQHFADQVDPDRVVAMFNIEMIGKPAAEGPGRAWITGWEESDFGEILQSAMAPGGFVFYGDPYPDQNLFFRSDNATLARLGVPAHSISTTPIDTDGDYHQVTDEIETLDLDHLTATIRAIAVAAEPVIAGRATPRRVRVEGR